MQEMSSAQQTAPFVKQLASNDEQTRDKAVESLRTFLAARNRTNALDELELLKLWKGLFFCMWFSDRPRTQQRLAVDLAALLEVVPDAAVMPFLDAFWKTMAREWNGIDVLRMNKFLFLVRAYLGASFRYLARRGGGGGGGSGGDDGAWRESAVRAHNAVLRATPLSAADGKVPNGLRYHVLDIFVDELDKAGALSAVDDDGDGGDDDEDGGISGHRGGGGGGGGGDDGGNDTDPDVDMDADGNGGGGAAKARRRGGGRDGAEDKQEEGGEEKAETAAAASASPPVELLLQPVRELSEQSPTKAVRRRAREVLADERLARCLMRRKSVPGANPTKSAAAAAAAAPTSTPTSTKRSNFVADGANKDSTGALGQAEADDANVAAEDEEEEWNGLDD